MKCENCGKNEANVKYTQIINGDKKQMFLCEECSEKLGIGHTFNMPIDFSSFLGDFFNDFNEEAFIPTLEPQPKLQCKKCGLLFDDFLHTGKFGCSNCYTEFENMIDPILKNIQSANRHIGRIGELTEGMEIEENSNDERVQNNYNKEISKQKPKNELDVLKEKLQKAIEDERYEDAAKIRDEIKKMEEKG